MTTQWMPLDQWNALKSGHGCPMCSRLEEDGVSRPGHTDDYGHTVADLGHSVLRLAADQFSPGYCVLIGRSHGPELHDLPDQSRAGFFADLVESNHAIATAMRADKMNIQILGNAVPHVHAHLVPRYHGDPSPGAPLMSNPNQPVTMSTTQYLQRAKLIRSHLSPGRDRT